MRRRGEPAQRASTFRARGVEDQGRRRPQGQEGAERAQQNAAQGLSARWNKLGTPEVVARPGGYLATGLPSDPVAAAQEWIADNRELLGLSAESAANLEVVATNPIGDGASVLLRQRFGDLAAGLDGLIAVGVIDGKVAFVSSSLSKDTALSGTATVRSRMRFAQPPPTSA